MTKNKLYRQGDVLIERITKIPTDAKLVDKAKHSRIILAEGEATGHHHSLDIDAADWWKTETEPDTHYLSVPKTATVTHQEHAPIKLRRGKYRVTRQREYSPEAIRRVAD